jgi:hypothetical protein
MILSESAAEYVQRHGLRSLMIASNCRRFERVCGRIAPDGITTEHLSTFRAKARDCLSAVTIEKTCTDVITIVKHCTGRTLEPGKRLRQPRPIPEPADLETIAAVFRHSVDWLRQWLVVSYWTGLRLSDAIALQATFPANGTAIRWIASKTGHSHAYPLPEWLVPHVQKLELPYTASENYSCRVLRSHLSAACLAAGVTYFHPHTIRQRSITEWSRVNGTAGSIIHGCGLGVLQHYVDPLSVLESAATRMRVPQVIMGEYRQADNEASLVTNFRKLDPSAQGLIVDTTERLARS